MKKDNILFILPSLKKTGPINVALNIIRNLDKSKINLTVLTFSNGDLYEEFKLYCDKVLIKSKISTIEYIIKNKKMFTKVHSHCVIPDLINSIFFRSKSISTLHNFISIDYIYEKGLIKGKILSKLHLYALSRINTTVACSAAVKDFVKHEYNLSTYHIDNGVKESCLTRERTNSHIQFLIVGICNERKNHSIAIEGFIDANIANSTLIICGDGPLLNSFKSKYGHFKNIQFFGSVPEPRELMSKSHVILSSSKAEGLPMAVLESLSEGLDYIISDITPHQYIHNKEKSIGRIVSIDSKSFSNAIKEINHEKIDHEKIQTFFRKNFSDKIMAGKYSNLYMG